MLRVLKSPSLVVVAVLYLFGLLAAFIAERVRTDAPGAAGLTLSIAALPAWITALVATARVGVFSRTCGGSGSEAATCRAHIPRISRRASARAPSSSELCGGRQKVALCWLGCLILCLCFLQRSWNCTSGSYIGLPRRLLVPKTRARQSSSPSR